MESVLRQCQVHLTLTLQCHNSQEQHKGQFKFYVHRRGNKVENKGKRVEKLNCRPDIQNNLLMIGVKIQVKQELIKMKTKISTYI